MKQTECEMRLDFDCPEFQSDPYPAYHRLRATDPVHQSAWGDWYLTRYDDVARAMSERSFRRQAPEGAWLIPSEPRDRTAFDRMMALWIMYRDPPDHTRLRHLMQDAFSASRTETLRPRIKNIFERLLDDVSDRPSFDVVADLAFPLPVIVISEILGVDAADRSVVQAWAQNITAALDRGRPEDLESAGPAVREMADFFRDLGQERLKRPREDLVSSLASAMRGGRQALGEDEFLANCAFLLFAGHETTKNLIANGVLALLRNRDQWDLLRTSPGVAVGAVEELLRYESPVQKMCRWTAEPVRMGEKTLPQGAFVVCLLGAANRDPKRFPEPDRLDIAREVNAHLAFGLGTHHCLGARLARAEAQIALTALARRMPDLTLLSERADWHGTTSQRGLKTLVVAPGNR